MSDTVPELYTLEGWNKTVETTKRRVVEASKERERHVAEAILGVTHDPLTGAKLDEPSLAMIVTIFGDPDKSKDEFALIVQSFAIAGNAFASIFSSEMWFSVRTWKPGEPMPSVSGVIPSKDPQRKEGIAVWTSHQQFGAQAHIAVIETENGKRQIGPWDTQENGMIGRFSNFVPQRKASHGDLIIVREFLRRRQLDKSLTLIPFKEFN